MPEYLRAYIVVMGLYVPFGIVFAHLARDMVPPVETRKWIATWLIVATLTFFVQNFWLFIALYAALVLLIARKRSDALPMFMLLVCATPMVADSIPGLGLVNRLFDVSPYLVLAAATLLPVFVKPAAVETKELRSVDVLVILLFVLTAAVSLRETTVTNTLRHAFDLFFLMVLPYFAMSRGIASREQFIPVFAAFVFALFVIAPLGIFETLKGWNIYTAAELGLGGRHGGYLKRAGLERADVMFSGSIVLGYCLMIAIGFTLALSGALRRNGVAVIIAVLVLGAVATLSRGPWVGIAVVGVAFVAAGRAGVMKLATAGVVAFVSLSFFLLLPIGQQLLDFVPFVGDIDAHTVTYRERLFTNALIVIERNPWLGSSTYLETPEMQAMRQGQGIIDIVNSYLQVTLETGLVGLTLFVLIFLVPLARMLSLARSAADREIGRLARALAAILCGILVTIATVSSIDRIPTLYWTLAGLAVAYSRIAAQARLRERLPTASPRPALANVAGVRAISSTHGGA